MQMPSRARQSRPTRIQADPLPVATSLSDAGSPCYLRSRILANLTRDVWDCRAVVRCDDCPHRHGQRQSFSVRARLPDAEEGSSSRNYLILGRLKTRTPFISPTWSSPSKEIAGVGIAIAKLRVGKKGNVGCCLVSTRDRRVALFGSAGQLTFFVHTFSPNLAEFLSCRLILQSAALHDPGLRAGLRATNHG